MKKNVFKTMVAAVCVVAAGMGGMKAYNAANQSEMNMLLAENVEALSALEGTVHLDCYTKNGYTCWLKSDHIKLYPYYNIW